MPSDSSYSRLPSELLDLQNVLVAGFKYNASDNLLTSNDSQGSYKNTTWSLRKSFRLPPNLFKPNSIRVKFDLKAESGGGSTASGQIRCNGEIIGTLQSTPSTSYVTKSEDIQDFESNSTLELWIKSSSDNWYAHHRNFRIYADPTICYLIDIPIIEWDPY